MTPDPPYSAASIDEPVDAVVNSIFDAACQDRLVVCAGAGLSRATPADLPSGAELGTRLDSRLRSLVTGYVPPEDSNNLIAVADAGSDLEGGKAALRSEVLRLAGFRSADPNFGHRVAAELLCEGAITLMLLWNWDDCIERVDVVPERLQVARSRGDLDDLEEPSIAKIHGCATRKSTMLITSEDLDQPPLWTDDAFRERVRNATVVFIGVGDIADYAKRRLEQLRDELAEDAGEGGDQLDIWVVSPTIRSKWDDSEWARLIPDLPEDRRIEMSADAFLDQLGRRWVRAAIDELERSADGGIRAEVAEWLRRIRGELAAIGAANVLRWSRRAALGQRIGLSVIFCDGLKELLVAFAVIAEASSGEGLKIRGPAAAELNGDRIEALIACTPVAADRVRERARRRAADLAGQGTIDDEATFLVSGTVWGALDDDPDPELDMTVGEIDPRDLVAGASGVRLSFLDASEMVRAA